MFKIKHTHTRFTSQKRILYNKSTQLGNKKIQRLYSKLFTSVIISAVCDLVGLLVSFESCDVKLTCFCILMPNYNEGVEKSKLKRNE
jgi:hypothetical protein